MASITQCEQAFATLAARIASADPAARKRAGFDRTLSCALPDLKVVFGGQLRDGELTNIHQVESPEAQIRLRMSSDDLIALVAGELALGGAWASGRIKVDASVMDLLKLRSVF